MNSQVQIAEALSKLLPADLFHAAPKLDHQGVLDRALQDGVFAGCQELHNNSCVVHNLVKVINIIKASGKMYFLVHLIPVLLFKRKQLKKKPVHTIVKMLLGWMRSVAFVCTYALVSRIGYCNMSGPQGFSRNTFLMLMPFACTGIFLEGRGRAMEIAMYVLPKYFETVPVFMGKMNLWPNVPLGMNFLTGLAFGLLASCYFTDSQCIKSYLRTVLRCILGKANDEFKSREIVETQTSDYKIIESEN